MRVPVHWHRRRLAPCVPESARVPSRRGTPGPRSSSGRSGAGAGSEGAGRPRPPRPPPGPRLPCRSGNSPGAPGRPARPRAARPPRAPRGTGGRPWRARRRRRLRGQCLGWRRVGAVCARVCERGGRAGGGARRSAPPPPRPPARPRAIVPAAGAAEGRGPEPRREVPPPGHRVPRLAVRRWGSGRVARLSRGPFHVPPFGTKGEGREKPLRRPSPEVGPSPP